MEGGQDYDFVDPGLQILCSPSDNFLFKEII